MKKRETRVTELKLEVEYHAHQDFKIASNRYLLLFNCTCVQFFSEIEPHLNSSGSTSER